ncbi:MAG: hypothetical protein QW757_05240 [Candidatus Woesearchaeota archaeon]
MGFFDSFKKKEDFNNLTNSNTNNLQNINLPPPPLPPSNIIKESNNLENNINKTQINQTITLPPPPLVEPINNNLNIQEQKIKESNINTPLIEIKNIENDQSISIDNTNTTIKSEPSNLESKLNLNLQETINLNHDINQNNKKIDAEKNIPNILPELPPLKLPNIKKNEERIDNHTTLRNNLINSNFNNEEIPDILPKIDINKEIDIPIFRDINTDTIKNFSIEKTNDDILSLPIINVFDFEEPNSNILYGINTTQKFQNKPLFVRVDHYSNILATIDSIKEYTSNSPNIIYSLENLKKNQDIEHKKFKNCIEDLQRKIIYVDKVLFQKEVF